MGILNRLRHAATRPAPALDMWCEFPLCDEDAVEVVSAGPHGHHVHLAYCRLHADEHTLRRLAGDV